MPIFKGSIALGQAPSREQKASPEQTGEYFVIQTILSRVFMAQMQRARPIPQGLDARYRGAIEQDAAGKMTYQVVFAFHPGDQAAEAFGQTVAAALPAHWDIQSRARLFAELKRWQANDQVRRILADLAEPTPALWPQQQPEPALASH